MVPAQQHSRHMRQIHKSGDIEPSFRHTHNGILVSITGKARSVHGIILRPDRLVMTGKRVVSRLAAGQSPYFSPRKNLIDDCGHHFGGGLGGYAGEKRMPGVRAEDSQRALVAV